MNKKVGNGNDSLFWLDNWMGDGALKVLYPRLFALEENKKVTNRVKFLNELLYGFRRTPRGSKRYANGRVS